MFDINFYSRQSEFHRYSTEDFALLSIGLGVYNKSSAKDFFETQNPDIKEFFGNTKNALDAVLGVNATAAMEILEFDVMDKTFKIKKGLAEILQLNPQKYPITKYPVVQAGNIEQFLDDWNKVQMGILTGPVVNSYNAIVDKIHNSVSGCISFKTNLNVLGNQRVANIILVPTYSRDNQSNRTMSFRGSPLISAVPKTAEGMMYSHSLTNQLPIGQYGSPFEGGDGNPKNNVAGNLRLTYDPTTGEFESGTQQILVRLVDDIDAAEMSDISGEAILSATPSDFYDDPESELFMGNFTKGRGVPLSMENGNPHMYGPNFKGGCTSSATKSIIIVVNRAPQAFKSGQLVMCSKINGEWVILPTGGQENLRKKISFGNFEYQQYILPASSFFMRTIDDTKGQFERILPSDVARKIRNLYYLKLAEGADDKVIDTTMNDIAKITSLNIFASTIPSDIEDPIQYIKDNYDPTEVAVILNQADAERSRDEETGFIQYFIDANSYLYYPDKTFDEVANALPKNTILKTARTLSLAGGTGDIGSSALRSAAGDLLYGDEVPFFWGMLFPDGYKSESTAPFIAAKREAFRTNPLFANDKNLRELSVLSNLGFPYVKDQVANLALIKMNIKNSHSLDNELRYVRKTSGLFVTEKMFRLFSGDFLKNIYDSISLNSAGGIFGNERYSTHDRFAPQHLSNLEPLKPNRIQFSSMSIEHLYSKSILKATEYSLLESSVNYFLDKIFRNGAAVMANFWASRKFGDVVNDWWRSDSRAPNSVARAGFIDNGNQYNLSSLLTEFFTQSAANRHPAPLGTTFLILPLVRGFRRSMAVPILTCKSKVKTSADSLTFTTSQVFGMSKRVSVSPADINVPIILPIGAGLAWNQPDAPIQVNSFPQWGDRNRSDSIDSFGTTALHVRVFEGWPINQTINLGHCFTPLHFNPSVQDIAKVITYNDEGNPVLSDALDDKGKPIVGVSEVDFRVPTQLSGDTVGSAFKKGANITEKNLAPFSQWKRNTIRRAKLLTNGGFIYLITYVGISKDSISIKSKGEGYTKEDKFVYPDGTEIKLLADGPISSIEITEGENGMSSVFEGLQPQYLGSTGKNAEWNKPRFVVKEKYGYDPGPKEVAPITRLTKPSNNGENLVEGSLTTSITLNNVSTTSKEYDIFYFYHNDPSHYSMDRSLAFNAGWAQYAIVELNPGA